MMILGVFGLIGVFLGWVLNQLTCYFANKPKLDYVFIYNPETGFNSGIVEREIYSGYMIEIINTGKSLVILKDIELFYRGKEMLYCVLSGDQRKILPNQSKYYNLARHDIKALRQKIKHDCGQFDVKATCVNGRRIDGKLDIIDFHID